MKPTSIADFLSNGVPLIYDGAMGTEIQKLGFGPVDAEGHPECNEIFNLTHPEAITNLHAGYFAAGATIVETNTIGGNRIKLEHFGFGDRVYEINRAAALAARAAVACVDRACFVCGAIGPTGRVPATDGAPLPFDEIIDVYQEQARGLIDGGVDLVLLETAQVLRELRAGIVGVRRAMSAAGKPLPLQVQATFDTHGRMLLGSDVKAFLGATTGLRPDIVGLNCGTGPDEMREHAISLVKLSPYPVSMLPNAGMPENVDGRAVYAMSAEAFAAKMAPMVLEHGVSVVGGCCGTSPEHIRALAEALKGRRVAARERPRTFCWLGSGISGVNMESETPPVIVGERLNTQGSRKTKELLLAGNWEELHQLAKEQAARQATLLDICVAVNERDTEAHDMETLVEYLSERVETPFCIDTTEAPVLERAAKAAPGAVLVNSVNLEHGAEKARRVLAVAREFGCAVIGLTIDDDGMARTVDRKMLLARRLRDLVCDEFAMPEHHLYIDPLVFTLATGEPESADAAVQSLDALRRIGVEMPGVRTIMGVSNVSFGLQPAARRVLNNLMLHEATRAGLRAAIYNPAHLDNVETYDPELRRLGTDLLLNRAPDALTAFVARFADARQAESEPKAGGGRRDDRRSAEDRLRRAILERDRRGLRELIDENLKSREPGAILNEILLPTMADVGDQMAAGKMILPFVLQAAEVMKEAVSILEPLLVRGEGAARGTIVLATVYGDVHDIGKNLVGSILRNQGFGVVDLGKQVPSEDVVAAVKRERPAAVGLSALLVTTSREMATVVRLLDQAGERLPVLVGGAAVNRAYAARLAELPDGRRYEGGVYYAKDAFEAVKTLERIRTAGPDHTATPPAPVKTTEAIERTPPKPAAPVILGERLEPPFYGTGEVLTWDTARLLDFIDRDDLYNGYWRGGVLTGERYAAAVHDEFEPAFERVRQEVLDANLVDARAYYSFFPVITDDTLVVALDPGDFHTELGSWRFPRVERKGGRSIADWLRPEGDVLAVQVVTIGAGIGLRSSELFQKEDRYSLGFYLNGLGNHLTELVAERVTREIRQALDIDRARGRRFAFGYPGMPGVDELPRIMEMLAAEERLGLTLTPGFQMVPEHSTLTIFVHHPDAEFL